MTPREAGGVPDLAPFAGSDQDSKKCQFFVLDGDAEVEYDEWLAQYSLADEFAPRHAAIADAKVVTRSRLKRARRFLTPITTSVSVGVVVVVAGICTGLDGVSDLAAIPGERQVVEDVSLRNGGECLGDGSDKGSIKVSASEVEEFSSGGVDLRTIREIDEVLSCCPQLV